MIENEPLILIHLTLPLLQESNDQWLVYVLHYKDSIINWSLPRVEKFLTPYEKVETSPSLTPHEIALKLKIPNKDFIFK